jgi:hypothetical protein
MKFFSDLFKNKEQIRKETQTEIFENVINYRKMLMKEIVCRSFVATYKVTVALSNDECYTAFCSWKETVEGLNQQFNASLLKAITELRRDDALRLIEKTFILGTIESKLDEFHKKLLLSELSEIFKVSPDDMVEMIIHYKVYAA